MHSDPRPTGEPILRRPGPIIFATHAIAFAALAVWSWRKWPDPVVDFGRELYVPWQITQGKVLFRDIASLFGPLSPYVNALWFRLFGTSLMTLAVCNMAILAATTAGIYHLVRISTDRLTAATATLTALLLFGFSQYLDVGNYNHITPYSHEATHGLALSVAALLALHRAFERRRSWIAVVSGCCSGLALLTKPEIGLSLAVAILAGFVAFRWITDGGSTRQLATAFAGGVVIPPIGFLLLFHLREGMPLQGALHAVGGGWIPALNRRVAQNAFYAGVTGFDRPAWHAFQMLGTFGGWVAAVVAAVVLATAKPTTLWRRTLVMTANAALLLAVALAVPYFQASRALPLMALIGCAAALASAARSRTRADRPLQTLPLVMWSAFAVLMLAKMFLNARVYHYGFYLALPATTVAVVVLVWTVPRLVAQWSGTPAANRARWGLVALIAVSIAPHLALSHTWFTTKTLRIGSGADAFLASGAQFLWQGEAVRQAVGWMEQRTRPDATLAVLPEGVMINYLARRATPVPFVNFMPPELTAFGEPAIVTAFDRHPPDYVMIFNRSTSEYGHPFFGADPEYGRQTMSWIRAHYEQVAEIGSDAAGESGRVVLVLQRKRSSP